MFLHEKLEILYQKGDGKERMKKERRKESSNDQGKSESEKKMDFHGK